MMNEERVPFFDLERAMKQGYVHDPSADYSSFSNEPRYCAVYYQTLRDGLGTKAKPCPVKCDTCRKVCETNDYIRGKLPPKHNLPSVPVKSLQEKLDECEREHIFNVLFANNGNMNATAKALGIHRTTLFRKIEQYKLR